MWECVYVCIVPWNGLVFCFLPSVPGMGFDYATTLTRMKLLLKVREGVRKIQEMKFTAVLYVMVYVESSSC